MPVTMQDVARAAGVSAKTVSNVLGDYPYVRDETRARVMAAVSDLGYQMNFAARTSGRAAPGLIMLALPELSLPYFADNTLAYYYYDAANGYAPTLGLKKISWVHGWPKVKK